MEINQRFPSLPVVMNHYVNESGARLTLTPACFARHCRALAEEGWRGVGLDEAEDYFLHGEALPAKSILITFDDGYLDNYFYALPALYAHGHKAAIFPVADRLEGPESSRPQDAHDSVSADLDKVKGDPAESVVNSRDTESAEIAPRAPLQEVLAGKAPVPPLVTNALTRTEQGFVLRRDCFCNYGELRAMEASGVFRTGAHGLGHYGVFTSPRYRDFFRPRTQLRTFYRTEEEPVWGLPDFPVRPGLRFRAFVPNPALIEAVRRLVPQNFDGAAAFFSSENEVRALRILVRGFAGRMGRYETDGERTERMWREIAGGKALLERVLGRGLRSLCWPWGRYCEEARRLAQDAGFQALFTVYGGANPPGRPLAVHRFQSWNTDGVWLTRHARMRSHALGAALLGLVGL